MKYDFILFEQLYSVENHYKDLSILASLLRDAGFKVAIADVFKEESLCKVDDVPHISLGLKCPNEFKELRTFIPQESSLRNLYYRLRKDIYLYKVIKKLKGKASNVYAGSLTLATPLFFFNAFDKNTNYFLWALRSSHVLSWKHSRISSLYYFISRILYINIKKYENLHLIVSNELIRNEFLREVGMNKEKLILRPERIIDKKDIFLGKGEKGKSLNLLFIGTLRPFKNVEFCINALKKLKDERITYTIAGRCKVDSHYNDTINLMIQDMPNVKRIDRYISEDEYEQLIRDCDYLVLCDKKQSSCASNGTMSEALLHGKPIIAPDIDPFKSEVEKYRVGLLYKYADEASMCEVLMNALYDSVSNYMDDIVKYQENYLRAKVVKNLKQQLSNLV